MGLDDAILIKDNHVRIAGGIEPALAAVRAAGLRLTVEIEADTLDQVEQALAAGAARILLDNMSPAGDRRAPSTRVRSDRCSRPRAGSTRTPFARTPRPARLLGGRHVVEQDPGGAGRERLLDLVERIASISTVRPEPAARTAASAGSMHPRCARGCP